MTASRRSPRAPFTALGRVLVTLLAGAMAAAPAPARSDTAPRAALADDGLGYLQRLAVRADAGDDTAAFLLGVTLASGRAGVRDDSAALRWFRQAAGAGLPAAQYNLALMLSAGRGAQRDHAEALRWYEAAGEQDMAMAQYNAAMLLLDGAPGVAADVTRAVAWLRRAAELRLAPAEYNLGVLREFGRGMPRDLNAAAAWYQRAARQGYEPARERLARLHGGALPAAPTRSAELPAVSGAGAAASTSRSPAAGGPVEVNGWVLARDPSRYTLQLFSTRDEQSVRDYLARHELVGQGGYFRFVTNGKRWFSVVYGDFESLAAAEQAGRQLRAELNAREPWIRTFDAIQKTLER